MKKSFYLEVLRVLALVCVIFNHSGEGGYFLFQTTNNVPLQIFSIFISDFCKIGVPLFLMISGALLIPKKETLKELFVKRILRIFIIIVLFSFIYYIRLYIQHPEYGFSLWFFVKLIYSEPFITPFWFLYLYMEFLLVLPFLRRLATAMSDSEYYYFILLGVLFLFLKVIPERVILEGTLNLNIPLLSSCILYPMLGCFLGHRLPERFFVVKSKIVAWLLILLNGGCCVIMTFWDFGQTGVFDEASFGGFSFLPVVATFFLIKYRFDIQRTEKTTGNSVAATGFEKVIFYVGSCAFCTYLFEEILRIDIFIKLFDLLPQIPSLLVCILYIICVIASGVAISSVLRHIPGLRKLGI